MAIIGEQNYGTPFGAITPEVFFDSHGNAYYSYSGYSARSGALGVSGTGAYTGFCGPHGLAFLPFSPTLTYPLNFEVLQGVVVITWSPAIPVDPCDTEITYEVQFTRNLSRKNGWRTIASDITETSLRFDVSQIAYTEDGGLRVRAKNSKGLSSQFSTTAEPFSIANHPPNQVRVINPVSGQVIDSDLTVSWIEATPKDPDGHSVIYTVEFTADFAGNSGWTKIPGGGQLEEGTTTFVADIFNLPEGSSYGLRVYAIDELGLAGKPSVVGPLTIKHSGLLIIDTIPPTGTIVINDGAVLASGPEVKLTFSAFDGGTGIKDMRVGNEGDTCFSDWEAFSPEKFWKLPASDGIKRVFVQFRDYANNVSSQCDCEIVERLVCGEGNITSLRVYNDKLYMAFDKNGNVVSYKSLISEELSLPEDSVTALEVSGGFLYIATYDGIESFLYSYTGSLTRVLSLPGEKITSMLNYGGNLYLSSTTGKIFKYTGTELSTVYNAGVSVVRLRTNGSLMYAIVNIGGYFLAYNGQIWDTISI